MKWANVEKKCRTENNKNRFSPPTNYMSESSTEKAKQEEYEKENEATELSWFHVLSFHSSKHAKVVMARNSQWKI